MLNNYPKLKVLLTVFGLVAVLIIVIVPMVIVRTAKNDSKSNIMVTSGSTTTQFLTTTASTSMSTTTPSSCSSPCAEGQMCFNDTCVYTGNLGISIIWSRSINCDIDIQTPNGWDVAIWIVYPPGPSEYTDYGQVDVTSEIMGPENVFWNTSTETPYGTYNICLEIYFTDEVIDEMNPVIATASVRKPSVATEIFTRTFISRTDGIYICDVGSSAYIASFNYP